MGILGAIGSCFAASIAAPWVQRVARARTGWLIGGFTLALTAYFASQATRVVRGETPTCALPWLPELDVSLSFRIDGLAALFAVLVAGIGALVAIYSGAYLEDERHLGRFYAFLLLFMASMLGLVLADNVLAMYVFWELTSISSYFLIGFQHRRAAVRAAAWQALLVTEAGGLALLAGLLLLGLAAGSFELSVLLERGAQVRAHPSYPAIVALVLAGAFTKSAQLPFSFWLPRAMEAPTPASAYLHAATMVKAGVYLVARLTPALSGPIWRDALLLAGAATMVVGAFAAVRQREAKRILAWSTVSALGTMLLLLGIGAFAAAMTYLAAHALYKGALFLVAGAVDHQAGEKEPERIGGLRRTMPVTAAAGGLAALSMAGLPPLLGFLAKEQLYAKALGDPLAWSLTAAAVVASALHLVAAALVGLRPFARAPTEAAERAREGGVALWLGPATLGAAGLLLALWPGPVAAVLSSAASAIAARKTSVELELWHGLELPLLLSAVTWGAGALAYLGRSLLRSRAPPLAWAERWGPERWYEWSLRGVNAVARAQTRMLQGGLLRTYLLVVLVGALGLLGYTLLSQGRLGLAAPRLDVRFYEAGLGAVVVISVVVAVRSSSRLRAIAALGAVGYTIGLIFLLMGSPDLAMTQFVIETLTVILLVQAFYHLPRYADLSTGRARGRDLAVSLGFGALMSTLVIAAAQVELEPSISRFYLERSVPEGHGRNVVNVILTDFRGIDTLGEITVVVAAAFGAFALLKLRLGSPS